MVKKTKELTLEEKLEQALVPVEEQPYEVPENWCWCRVGVIATIHRGVSYKKHESHSEKRERDCLILRGGNIKEGSILTEGENVYVDVSLVSDEQIIKKDDIVIVASTGSTKVIGRAGVSDTDYTNVAFGAFLILVRPIQNISSRYVDYFFQSDLYRNRIRQLANGVNINNIRMEYITETPCPLPPLAEQQRIVDRIESLFARLDGAKELAEDVIHSSELRKSAMLHKAFTGKLTAKWRKEHGVRRESWETLTLNDIAEYKKGPFGSSITKAMFVPKADNTYKVYEQGNAIRKTLDYGYYYISEQKYKELIGFSVRGGDILISCAGTIGEIYKLPEHCEAGVINQALMRVRVYNNIDERFFVYYFSGVLKGNVINQANGTAIKNIPPFKVMKAMEIHLPSLKEQQEIVTVLDKLLVREQQAKEAAETVLEQIDIMKKAILAHAFRGKLGTNIETEKSAIERLQEILK